jgi:transposase InsO family protein
MRSVGLLRRKGRRAPRHDEDTSFVEREVRSFEAEHPNALWHLDFHHGRKKVLTGDGRWVTPILLAILDDCSRLCCHAQWYLEEDTEALVHGFIQAIQKRGVPRMLLNDNGGPMISAEFVGGLERLGVVARRTLSRSPYQNGKQETWFGRVEGRLIPMLENVSDLDLRTLNDATAVWIEEDYNRKVHSELAKKSPFERFLGDDDVGRKSPGSEDLRDAFRMDIHRTVRRGDATVTIDGHRFEVPGHLRNLKRVRLRYARWNFGNVHLVDERSGEATIRIYPVDKHQNADSRRRVVQHDPGLEVQDTPSSADGIAPLLREMLEEYAATGLPPAYISKEDGDKTSNDTDQEIAP